MCPTITRARTAARHTTLRGFIMLKDRLHILTVQINQNPTPTIVPRAAAAELLDLDAKRLCFSQLAKLTQLLPRLEPDLNTGPP